MNKGPLMPPQVQRRGDKTTHDPHAGLTSGTPLAQLSFSSPFDGNALPPFTQKHTAESFQAKFRDIRIGDTTIRVELAI